MIVISHTINAGLESPLFICYSYYIFFKSWQKSAILVESGKFIRSDPTYTYFNDTETVKSNVVLGGD